VEHLASSWGVRADERGTTVWAVLPAPRDGGAWPRGGGPGGATAAAGRPATAVDGRADGAAARPVAADGAGCGPDGAGRQARRNEHV